MFEIGDYIIYGTNGVCKVEDIGPIKGKGLPSDKAYYTLAPVYIKGSKVYTPVDNDKVIMRSVISKNDATALIDDIINIETIPPSMESNLDDMCKKRLHSCDCREIIQLIKTLYERRQLRLSEGKKASLKDEKYFHIAEEAVYGEFAIALNINRKDIAQYISARIAPDALANSETVV
jgi:CarD family transcriptional regulator